MSADVISKLTSLGNKWTKAKEAERTAAANAYAAIVQAHAAGVPETQIASAVGVDRMTVRRALGKR